MLEKRFLAISPIAFTADGQSNGVVTIPDTSLFKVKQKVILNANGQPILDVEVKQVLTPTTMIVGPKGAINLVANLTAYTVLMGANISANEQLRPTIGADDFERAVYEEEPTVAKRVVMVDKYGNKYDDNNPLPIAFDGTVQIGDVEVKGSNGNTLEPNSDGSINVVLENSPDEPGLVFSYNEITSVASGVVTNLITMTGTIGGTRVSKIDVSGENVALYTLLINGTPIMVKRTWWTEFNQSFSFDPNDQGLLLKQGDTLLVTVVHNRPNLANFEATIIVQS